MCPTMRVVVVLPLVPVMAAIGMRYGVPFGNSMSITGPATSRAFPSVGAVCMRKPGAALTSTIAPPTCLWLREMSGEMKSTPPTSRPIALTARSAMIRLS